MRKKSNYLFAKIALTSALLLVSGTGICSAIDSTSAIKDSNLSTTSNLQGVKQVGDKPPPNATDSLEKAKDEHPTAVESVQVFYEAAWSHLVWLISIFGSLLGIGVPLFVAHIQKESNKNLRDALERDFNTKLESSKISLKEDMLLELEKKEKELVATIKNATNSTEESLNKKFFRLKAAHDFSTGDLFITRKDYAQATTSYLRASSAYSEIQIPENVMRAFGNACTASKKLSGQNQPSSPKGYSKQKESLEEMITELNRLKTSTEKYPEMFNQIENIPDKMAEISRACKTRMEELESLTLVKTPDE